MHNNRELRRFVDEHSLSYKDISKLIGVPLETCRNWLRSESSIILGECQTPCLSCFK